MTQKEQVIDPDEAAVGILCFANKAPGFQGVLRERFTDFIVHEVDENENIVSFEDGWNFDQEEIQKANAANEEKKKSTEIERGERLIESLKEISAKDATRLESWLEKRRQVLQEQGENSEANCPENVLLGPSADKGWRRTVHGIFKQNECGLETDTITASQASKEMIASLSTEESQNMDKLQFIRVFPRALLTNPGRKNKRARDRGGRPYDKRSLAPPKPYVECVMLKENIETNDALLSLARELRTAVRNFTIAGTKDKRAVTCQRINIAKQSIYDVKTAAINACKAQSLRTNGKSRLAFAGFKYVDEPLWLGKLFGNRFKISMRRSRPQKEGEDIESVVGQAVESIKSSGFINYFGLQRFGKETSKGQGSHHIGAALLRGDFKGAVELILKPRESQERPESQKARRLAAEGKLEEAAKAFPSNMTAEKCVLNGLINRGSNNYVAAVQNLPGNLRTLYIHAFQSYLWNIAASYRAQNYGTSDVLLGDLVAEGGSQNMETPRTDENAEKLNSEEEAEDKTEGEGANWFQKFNVHVVNEQDLSAKKYTIDDVIIPLVGRHVIYPQAKIFDAMKAAAADLSVCIDPSEDSSKYKPHNVNEFWIGSHSGDYRKFLSRPKGINYQTIVHTSHREDLSKTEFEVFHRMKRAKIAASGDEASSDAQDEEIKQEEIKKEENCVEHKAVQFEFVLQSSTYATIALRELTKESSSTSFHKALTEQALGKQEPSSLETKMEGINSSSDETKPELEKQQLETPD